MAMEVMCGRGELTSEGLTEHLFKLQCSQRTAGSVVKHQGAWSPSGFLHRFPLRSLL